MDDWLDLILWLLPWDDPFGRARRHKRESEQRLRILAATETALAQDQASRNEHGVT